jgi:MFS family permease
MFFTVLNASAIGVLLPQIATDLGIGTGKVSWLMTGFLLVYGVAIPFYGRIADMYGAPRLFMIGLVVFTLESPLAVVAPNYELLLTARIIQTAGGAPIPGLGIAIASRTFPARSAGTGVRLVERCHRCWISRWASPGWSAVRGVRMGLYFLDNSLRRPRDSRGDQGLSTG